MPKQSSPLAARCKLECFGRLHNTRLLSRSPPRGRSGQSARLLSLPLFSASLSCDSPRRVCFSRRAGTSPGRSSNWQPEADRIARFDLSPWAAGKASKLLGSFMAHARIALYPIATLGANRLSGGDGTLRTAEGRSVDDSLSVFSYQVSDLALSGAQADFVKVDLVATSASQLRVTWAADGRPLSEPIAITPATNSTTLLIPLGATPSWLLSKRIDTLRFEVVGIDAAHGSHPILQNVTLLHLQAAR